MALDLLARITGVAVLLLLLGAESTQCVDKQMNVTSTADAQDLSDALNCTGGGNFNVTWYGSVAITQTFEVADGISLNVTGSNRSSMALDDGIPPATIRGNELSSDVGMFYVSGASTLTLDNLVLQGVYSEERRGSGAIEAQGSVNAHLTVNVIDCLFTDNYGYWAGGIYAHNFVVVNVYGATSFISNIALYGSGALIAENDSQINLYGSSTFRDNVGTYGGALSVSGANSTVRFGGDSNFVNNTATRTMGGGGAVSVILGSVTIAGGNTTFTNNTSDMEGGAVHAISANLHIKGAIFNGNSADKDGGAIFAEFTNLSITGDTTFTSNVASRSGGGLYARNCDIVDIAGNASFVGNSASNDGGAISIDSVGELHVDDATFVLNAASSGGAVSVIATTVTGSDPFLLRRCVFEGNRATDGGALYLFNSARIITIEESLFLENNALASGGAIYSTGYITPLYTRFVANEAGVQGMAVTSLGGLFNPEAMLFENNARYCPLGQYGYDKDIKVVDNIDICRAEVVCTRCSEGCHDIHASLNFPPNSTVPAADCKNLPVGTIATSAGTTLATLTLEKGYYRTFNDSHVVFECYQKDSCVGGLDTSNYCAAGYEGPYCAVCAEGYAQSIAYGCYKCSGASLGSSIGLALAGMLVIIGVAFVLSDLVAVVEADGAAKEGEQGPRGFWRWRLSSCYTFLVKIFSITSIKIVVVVWQIISQFATIAGDVYLNEYQQFLSKLNPINLDVGLILSYSCIADINFYSRLLLSTTMALVVLAGLALTYAIATKRNAGSEIAKRSVQHKHLSAALFVAFFVYSSVSFTVLQTFVCDPLDNGVAYLRADYSLSCSSDQHNRYFAYASVMVWVYPIGIPAAFMYWLARNKHALSQPNRETVNQLQPFSGLWVAYRPLRFYYEVVEYSRRIALTAVAVFVLPGSAAQIAVVLLLAVVFSFISESMRPFQESIEMGLYRWGNGIVLASMYVALLRKVDVSGEDTPAQSVFAGVLIAANVFMIVAVLVQSALLVAGLQSSKPIVEVDDPRFRSFPGSSETCTQVGADSNEADMDGSNAGK